MGYRVGQIPQQAGPRHVTDPYLPPCTKLKSKWIKDLNIKPATLNLIEEKVGSTLVLADLEINGEAFDFGSLFNVGENVGE